MAASLLTIDRLVEDYAQLASVVRPAATPRIAPDPNDDVVIGTALAAKAEMIVTGDKPQLSVIEHEGVRIVAVAQAIEAIDVGSNA
jgi:predicted nucleic acid-binding protein